MKIWHVTEVLVKRIYDTSDWWSPLVNKRVKCTDCFNDHYMINWNGGLRGISKELCTPTEYEFTDYPEMDITYPLVK